MKRIFKYPLQRTTKIHKGFKVLSVQSQRNEACLWAEVDTEAELILLDFVVVPTGGAVPVDLKYIGTALVSEDHLVWHFYI